MAQDLEARTQSPEQALREASPVSLLLPSLIAFLLPTNIFGTLNARHFWVPRGSRQGTSRRVGPLSLQCQVQESEDCVCLVIHASPLPLMGACQVLPKCLLNKFIHLAH